MKKLRCFFNYAAECLNKNFYHNSLFFHHQNIYQQCGIQTPMKMFWDENLCLDQILWLASSDKIHPVLNSFVNCGFKHRLLLYFGVLGVRWSMRWLRFLQCLYILAHFPSVGAFLLLSDCFLHCLVTDLAKETCSCFSCKNFHKWHPSRGCDERRLS